MKMARWGYSYWWDIWDVIQADLQNNKNVEAVELPDFTDLEVEGNDCSMIRTGKSKKKIDTYKYCMSPK